MKKILLAVDGSESCNKAVNTVIELSYLIDFEVTILNVVEDKISIQATNKKGITDEINKHDSAKKSAKEIVTECANNFNEDTKVEKITREGVPAEIICEEAGKEDYDLVVISDMGRNSIQKFLLGSTTEKVVRHCKKSVLVAK